MGIPNIVYGTFISTSGPAAVNLDLGFIPDEFECWEADATAGEQVALKFLLTAGTGKGWTSKTVVDTGSTGNATTQYVASSHIATYAPTPVATPGPWKASTAYVVGDVVHPVTYLGSNPALSYYQAGTVFYYKCTTAGTTAASEPTWPTTLGGTSASDNGVVWTAIAYGGSGTSFTPAVSFSKGQGVTIPAALLKASTAYHWKAVKASAAM